MFPSAVLVGEKRLMPVSVHKDQLLCLPEPFTPLNGFSWSNTVKLCLVAIRFIKSITNWLWSFAKFTSSKIGANSNWLGAASL